MNAARYEIRTRSVYGWWPVQGKSGEGSWDCLEFGLPIDQWLDLDFAEPVPWLLISYSPREPDVCSEGGRVGQEDSWLVTDRRPKREALQAIQVNDESDFEEED